MKNLILLLWLLPLSTLAQEVGLTCSGQEIHKHFSLKTGVVEHESKIDRKFNIIIDEEKNSFTIGEGFAMCYLTEFNRQQSNIKEVESKTTFLDQGVFYYCHSQSQNDKQYLSVKYKGSFTIDRLSGDMKSENFGIDDKSSKVLEEAKGKFNCSVLERKF